MAAENDAPLFFLDSFPKEVLGNVLRFISRLPNAKKWESHIQLQDLVRLFGIHGELGNLVRSSFDTLCVSLQQNCQNEYSHSGWKLRTEPHLWTKNINIARDFVLAGGGGCVKTLVVGRGINEITPYGQDLVNDFGKNCPNVTSLSIDANRLVSSGMHWLKQYRKQLEKLEVIGIFEVVFPCYFPKLRELTLMSEGDYLLGHEGFQGRRYSFYTDIMQLIGGTLEKLVLPGTIRDVREVDQIKLYCRNLKCISLGGDYPRVIAEIASLLTSYGDQLEYALLRRMNEDQLQNVSDACPNAQFHLVDYGHTFSVGRLKAIGSRLKAISIHGRYENIGDKVECTNAWAQCSNLRELRMNVLEAEDVDMIFATPKEQLEILELSLPEEMDWKDAKKAMEVCARGTKYVGKLIYCGPAFFLDSLIKFFGSNKASLSSFIVEKPSYMADIILDELLDSILVLPELEELVLNCEMPENMLKTLQKRGVYWKRTLRCSG